MRTFYIIALLLWILLSTFWSKRTFCGDKTAKKPSAAATAPVTASGDCNTSLLLEDGDFNVVSKSNFLFKSNGTKFVSPKGEFKEALTAVASYLDTHQDRTLLIEGVYFEKENNPSSKDNLGLGRASALKTFLVDNYGISENQLLIGAQESDNMKCYYNKENNLITKGAVFTFGER